MFRDCKTSSVFAWYVALLQNQHGAEWVLVRETRPRGSQLHSRPGVRCSIDPGSHSIHRGNRVESRPRGLQLQPRPRVRCSIDPGSHRSIEETASSPGPVDHNCNASRRVSLDESPQRSNVIESCIDSRLLENRGLRFLGGGFSNQKLLCDCGKGF